MCISVWSTKNTFVRIKANLCCCNVIYGHTKKCWLSNNFELDMKLYSFVMLTFINGYMLASGGASKKRQFYSQKSGFMKNHFESIKLSIFFPQMTSTKCIFTNRIGGWINEKLQYNSTNERFISRGSAWWIIP